MKHAAPSSSALLVRRLGLPLAASGAALGLVALGITTPAFAAGNGGNADCADPTATAITFEGAELSAGSTQVSDSFTATITAVDGTPSDVRSFDYAASAGLVELIVKGGSTSYSATNPPLVGSAVVGPAGGGSGTFGVSNVTFCFTEVAATTPPPTTPLPVIVPAPVEEDDEDVPATPTVGTTPVTPTTPTVPVTDEVPADEVPAVAPVVGGSTPDQPATDNAPVSAPVSAPVRDALPLDGESPDQPATGGPVVAVPVSTTPDTVVDVLVPLTGDGAPQAATADDVDVIATAGAAPAALPFTGASTGAAGALGAMLLLFGGAAVALGRRPSYAPRHALV